MTHDAASASFNPRVREGRDRSRRRLRRVTTVSIHASVKDATRNLNQSVCGILCFNPRVREGRDNMHPWTLAGLNVSIHASVKDATQRRR